MPLRGADDESPWKLSSHVDEARPDRTGAAPDPLAHLTGGGVARLAFVGLGVVLALFAVVAVGGALLSSRATDDARTSGDIAESYLTALAAVALADVAEGTYQVAPSAPVRADFDRAARQGDVALARLEELGTPRPRALRAVRGRGAPDVRGGTAG